MPGQVVGTFQHDATSQDAENKIYHEWVGVNNDCYHTIFKDHRKCSV